LDLRAAKKRAQLKNISGAKNRRNHVLFLHRFHPMLFNHEKLSGQKSRVAAVCMRAYRQKRHYFRFFHINKNIGLILFFFLICFSCQKATLKGELKPMPHSTKPDISN